MNEEIVIVDENDQMIGTGEKMAVHESGQLHRAFSVVIFNLRGEMLLQKRARSKYHSGGLWTNACCSHPYPDEDIVEAARKRLKEEMGIEAELEEKFGFIYHADLDNGLIEYEFDHVLEGKFDGDPRPNPEEAEDWKWVDVRKLKENVKANPEEYTKWLGCILEKY